MAVAASPGRQVQLEQQLLETGNRLVNQTLSIDELLSLLDRLDHQLSSVDQSPPPSMSNALSISLNALVEDRYLRHPDVDVQVAVASCISEITRITAPEAPYDDDKMKDVFQLIVSSFKDLSDQSSRSFAKRVSILDTVAKVRSCVVMLDLECNGLIVEMFQHFLKAIRDYHSDSIFSSMETIMTLVLEESEDVSLELLSPILASVKKDNEDVLPIARKLGERVLETAADKLKPYLAQAIKSLTVSVEDYSEVVAVICDDTSGASEQNGDNSSGQLAEEVKLIKASSEEAAQAEESKLTTASSEETTQAANVDVTEGATLEEASPAADRSPKTVMSNGILVTENDETSVEQESLKKQEQDLPANEPLNVNVTSKDDDSDTGKSIKSDSETEQTAERKERNSNHVTNSKESSDSFHAESENEPEKLSDCQENLSKDAQSSLGENASIEADPPLENENDSATPSAKASEVETIQIAALSPSRSIPDESCSKKSGRSKKQLTSTKVDGTSTDVVLPKAPEGISESEVKHQKRPGKKVSAGTTKKDKIPVVVHSESEDVCVSGSKGKIQKDSKGKIQKEKSNKGDAEEEDAKPLRRTVKKGDSGDSEAKPLKQSGQQGEDERISGSKSKTAKEASNKGDAADEDAKPLRRTVKKGDSGDSEAKSLKQSGQKGEDEHISGSKGKTAKEASNKGDADDNEAKHLRQSVKKGDAGASEAKHLKQSGKKGLKSPEPKPLLKTIRKDDASISEAKAQKQLGMRGDASDSEEDKPSLKIKEKGRKRGRGPDVSEKDLAKSDAEKDEMISSPKSTTKSAKEEDHFEEPNTTSSKRKRTPAKKKASEPAEHGANIIGSKIKVWWPEDDAFYDGVIKSYNPEKKKHKVLYTDGEVEILNLKNERWEFLDAAGSMSDGEHAAKDSSTNGSIETHKRKKAKTDTKPSPTQDAMEISSKSSGGATSTSKLKASVAKSGRKTKVEEKADGKSKVNPSKSGDKPGDHSSVKSVDKSKRSSGKSADETPVAKSGAKSKDIDVVSPKPSSKSKQGGSSKTVNKSKSKATRQTGSKSNKANNGSGKEKSSSSKVMKESDSEKENSLDSEKTTEDVKEEKSPETTTSKVRKSGTKSGGKKRKRRG